MRVYLPATLPRLAGWLGAGQAELDAVGPGAVAFMVTASLREWYYDADLDELEHAAQLAAAEAALALLAADPAAARRRVVIAADADEVTVTPLAGQGRAAVAISVPVPVARWASALVDDPGSAPAVEAAVRSLDAARAGDDDAQFVVAEAEAHELGWYAVQELRYLCS
jgi:uncharacterized protein DUF6912